MASETHERLAEWPELRSQLMQVLVDHFGASGIKKEKVKEEDEDAWNFVKRSALPCRRQ